MVQVCAAGERALRGAAMRNVAVLEAKGAQSVGLAVDEEGRIAGVGWAWSTAPQQAPCLKSSSSFDRRYDSDLDQQFVGWRFNKEIDATGCAIVPGLVDAHTHPVWEGDRVNEFAMKVRRERERGCGKRRAE